MEKMDINFERYLKEALDIQVQPKKWKGAEQLPFFLLDQYGFFEVRILDRACLLIVEKGETEQTPATIKKHILQIQKKWPYEVIYVQQKVTAYNRKRLIEQKLPFVIPGNQMYLPFLGVDLREYFKRGRKTEHKWSPSTQAIVIYALLHDGELRFTPRELANPLGYTAMTMTRAFDELAGAELGQIAVEGRERVLCFDSNKKELWNNATKVLRSPVKKRMWIKHFPDTPLGMKAGLSALAYYSDLAEPEYHVIALGGNAWKKLWANKKVEVLTVMEPGACEVEIWIYPPELFAKDGVVDRFSLYLSITTNEDERVESGLEKMMGQVAW